MRRDYCRSLRSTVDFPVFEVDIFIHRRQSRIIVVLERAPQTLLPLLGGEIAIKPPCIARRIADLFRLFLGRDHDTPPRQTPETVSGLSTGSISQSSSFTAFQEIP